MTLQAWLVYLVAAIVIGVGLLFGRRGHRMRTRDVTGGVVASEIAGSVTINTAASPSRREQPRGSGDRVGWAIAIIGALIAAAQFAYEIFGAHK
jgi:type IV secretory pathway VirB2 component (pilin)